MFSEPFYSVTKLLSALVVTQDRKGGVLHRVTYTQPQLLQGILAWPYLWTWTLQGVPAAARTSPWPRMLWDVLCSRVDLSLATHRQKSSHNVRLRDEQAAVWLEVIFLSFGTNRTFPITSSFITLLRNKARQNYAIQPFSQIWTNPDFNLDSHHFSSSPTGECNFLNKIYQQLSSAFKFLDGYTDI